VAPPWSSSLIKSASWSPRRSEGAKARRSIRGSFGAAAAWLRRQHALGAIVAGSCNGVFLLGEAGLLDGRRCTTTWWRHNELKSRYPRADAAWGASLIEDGRVVTAGGPLSWIDLTLHVIRALLGPEAAKKAADFTVVDTVPSTQAIYVPPGHLSASNPFLLEAEHIVRQAGDAPLTSIELARALGVSERTLHRRLKEASGETPKHFLDRVRFDMARMLLETTRNSVKQLAAASGYADETSFRRAFRRYSGMTPGAYRSWSHARRGVK
jgi:transcriptional regulator GlxA family with amidase domain